MKRLMSILCLGGMMSILPATAQEFKLGPEGYFQNQGVNVMGFDDIYPEGHQGGVSLIMHGHRVATNGDIRLEPTPGQWQPVPKQRKRDLDPVANTITARLSFPDSSRHLTGFNPMIYPDLAFDYTVTIKGEGGSVVVTVDLDRPIPQEFIGKVGFNLELFPGALFGKPWIMDTQTGIFPQQANGPTRYEPANHSHTGNFNPEGKGSRGGFLNQALSYSPVKFNKKKLPLLLEKDGKVEPLSSFAFWSNADTKALSNAETLRDMEAIAIAEEIESLLKENVLYDGRRLRPSDIAILVAKRFHADKVIEELRRRGIRTLRSSNENVLCSKEAHELKNVLEAMYDPRDTRLVAAAQATRIFGDSLNDLLNNDAASAQARLLLENSATIYEKSGIIAAVSNLFAGAKTEERLLQYGGERALTNYQHILELLHQQHNTIDNLQGLLRWLKQEKEKSNENYKLRRETDSDVVRIETIHSSKGLQYPVVYYLDRPISFSKGQKFRDDATGVITFYETEQKAPDDFVEKSYEESMRLLYVAMTRATARVVLPYFFKKTKNGAPHGSVGGKNPLAQAISGETSGGLAIIGGLNRLREALSPKEASAREVRKALLDGISEYNKNSAHPLMLSEKALNAYTPFEIRFDFEPGKYGDSEVSFRQPPEHLDLRAGRGEKQNRSWISSSFTSLLRTMEAQDSAVITDESEALESEETVAESKEEDVLEVLKGTQSAAEFGTKVHELLEKIFDKNFHNWKNRVYKFLDDRFKGYVAPETEERKAEIETKTEEFFENLFEAKILPSAPGFHLSQLFKNLKDCRPELKFMLSVGAPIKGRERLTASLLAETLTAFDSRYKDFHLSELDMRGYLTGSIDLAFAADGKYWVIDWKTNKIDYRNNTPELYTPEAVNALMKNNHYELQLALYLVALKRMLEVRLNLPEGTGYKAIGGAVYCFLRGIDRNARGTYFERPKDVLIECLDDFLKNGFSRELLESRAKGAV